ncbi:RNHCP domain-containing protein [Fodinisporobacter ferrooxydans]|uniref:RNHCP domain-containing protein n=1 Tax=Fodinisporobacter ferrooxydans TaxID=2901836 RepID=A0ABY4CHE9_9BACL|nr:RNHCP domain-containing protein [Alicyclobacillaceae bacterium MYW30-H2]
MTDQPQFTVRNESFTCINCHTFVHPLKNGSCRNHCPECLYSLHLDDKPGDRNAQCGGILEPVAIELHTKKGYQIVHQCKRCGHKTKNKMALDDPGQPDSYTVLLEIMRRQSMQ